MTQMHYGIDMVYLTSPYSDESQMIKEERYQVNCRVAAALMPRGVAVFSPIVHRHLFTRYLPTGCPNNHKFWMEKVLPFLESCHALAVLCLNGWDKSPSLDEEIRYARVRRKPMVFIPALATDEMLLAAIQQITNARNIQL